MFFILTPLARVQPISYLHSKQFFVISFQRTLWHYHEFCRELGQEPYPGNPKTIGACLSLRAKKSQSVSMVDKLYCAVSHEHKKRFLDSPTDHPSVRLLMRSIRRHLAQPRCPVAPLTPAHLLSMNQHLLDLGSTSTLELWRTVWRNNMQYYSACRFSEINNLHSSDISVQLKPEACVILHIRKSKTDQLQIGAKKYIHSIASNTTACPVRLTLLYLARLRSHLPSTTPYCGFLQPRVRLDSKLKKQVPLSQHKISYSSCLEETRALLQLLNIPGRFGEHSGRRGAATQAAANGGSLLEIQTLGGWKSSSNAQKYIHQQTENNSKLSKLLLPSL